MLQAIDAGNSRRSGFPPDADCRGNAALAPARTLA